LLVVSIFVGFISCNQRSGANEESKGCNYFKWLNEDNGDERDATIRRQRRKIYALEKSVMVYEKRIKFLTWVICFLGLVNVILVCKLSKIFWFCCNLDGVQWVWMQFHRLECLYLRYVIVMDYDYGMKIALQ